MMVWVLCGGVQWKHRGDTRIGFILASGLSKRSGVGQWWNVLAGVGHRLSDMKGCRMDA